MAISTGCQPVLFYEGISWEAYFVQPGSGPRSSQLRRVDIGSFLNSSNRTLDSRISNIWHDAQEFCTVVNLAHLTHRKLKASLFQEIMVSLQYRLLQLNQSPHIIPQGSLHETIRLGVLAFTTTVFLQTINNSTRYLHLASSLTLALMSLDQPLTSEDWELRLWIMVVATDTVFSCNRYGNWLREKLHVATKALQVSSWQEFKAIMKKFLWIDTINDAHGQKIFDMCTADQDNKNASS